MSLLVDEALASGTSLSTLCVPLFQDVRRGTHPRVLQTLEPSHQLRYRLPKPILIVVGFCTPWFRCLRDSCSFDRWSQVCAERIFQTCGRRSHDCCSSTLRLFLGSASRRVLLEDAERIRTQSTTFAHRTWRHEPVRYRAPKCFRG